jgi:DNA-binding transcriptional MocR family regulator
VGAQIADRVKENRARLRAAVRESACQLLDAEGGWSAVLRVPHTLTEEEWVIVLAADGVLVHPGFFFDFDEQAYLVVSLLGPPEDFAAGIMRLISRIAQT